MRREEREGEGEGAGAGAAFRCFCAIAYRCRIVAFFGKYFPANGDPAPAPVPAAGLPVDFLFCTGDA